MFGIDFNGNPPNSCGETKFSLTDYGCVYIFFPNCREANLTICFLSTLLDAKYFGCVVSFCIFAKKAAAAVPIL